MEVGERMKEIVLIKAQDGSLRPATEADAELLAGWKVGQGVKVEAKQVSVRSLQHHKLFFGGLLKLTMDYWEGNGNLVTDQEIKTLKRFAVWLDEKSGSSGALNEACRTFLNETNRSRKKKVEAPGKSMEGLLVWLKLKIDHAHLVSTPDGPRKMPSSINFRSMGQDGFNEFYKRAFSFCWQYVLSQTFESEEEAENAINQMASMC
jgi:hypothetical protein